MGEKLHIYKDIQMTRILITTTTVALCLLLTLSSVNSVELNQPAPDFTFTDIRDKKHKLSDYQGKVVLVIWSSVKTREDNKKFNEAIYKKYPDEDISGKGDLVYINVFDLTDKPFYATMSFVKKRMVNDITKRERQGTHRHLFLPDYGGKFRNLYKHPKKRYVHFYVIDKKGLIKYHYSGELAQREKDKVKSFQRAVDKAGEFVMQLQK